MINEQIVKELVHELNNQSQDVHIEYTLLIDEHTWVISCSSKQYPGFAFNSCQFDDRHTLGKFFTAKVKAIVDNSQAQIDKVVSDYKKNENVSELYQCCKLAVEMSKLPIGVNTSNGAVEIKFVLFSTSKEETKTKVNAFIQTLISLKSIL